ncbi:MAG: M17 family peptidase N-terminal domain-containing protein [Nitrospirota bacterium]|nr:M17 family peptidase N-terminal domain-containing protein [Nitrospirota bacterium]
MKVEVYSGSLNRLRTEVLALGCFKDIRPLHGWPGEIDWFYSGVISRLMMQNHFTGFHGEILLIPTEGKLHISKVILIGLGPSAPYDVLQFEKAVAKLLETIEGLQTRDCAIATASFCGKALETPWVAASFMHAWQETHLSQDLSLVINDIEQAKAFQHKIRNGTVFEADQHTKSVKG